MRPTLAASVLALALLLTSCGAPLDAESAPSTSPSRSTSPTPTPTPPARLMADDADPDGALAAELLAMLERDQAGRLGGEDGEGDQARTDRLGEIMNEFGWPTISAVGEDAATAAWAIAQHSDLDPDFQRLALAHLEVAAAEGEASLGDLAYLTDRVAANSGEPQTYGTQVGCGPEGPVPGVPIADEAAVDERRAAAGLAPLADYYAEMAEICAEASAEG